MKILIYIDPMTLTDLTVLATKVWFAPANIRLDSVFTRTSILARLWFTLIPIYTQV